MIQSKERMKPCCNLYDTTGTNPATAGGGFDLRTFRHVLRIGGLIPFTGCAILIGFVVTLWEVGFSGADCHLFVLVVVAVILIHIDAHLWNDIIEAETDRYEKSKETKCERPLICGWATRDDYRRISKMLPYRRRDAEHQTKPTEKCLCLPSGA
ncbi:hypothetical protein L1S32_00045 [Methanogenium sp. S4BF]|uniref:hypothetical protein n=1 Tax=Methanogenium sp. S4BF TaxID=1789226 RepID=UPI002417370E|nr:hypothetical protein [Methanogenium sp. S4BF]WFN34548.1 hypothetical protein L1S32_00045 [Methanogenium sp. S4BF]